MNRRISSVNSEHIGCGGCLTVLIAWVIGTFACRYTVDFWASYIKHKAFILPWLPSIVGGILFPAFAPAAILTWLCSFFI